MCTMLSLTGYHYKLNRSPNLFNIGMKYNLLFPEHPVGLTLSQAGPDW